MKSATSLLALVAIVLVLLHAADAINAKRSKGKTSKGKPAYPTPPNRGILVYYSDEQCQDPQAWRWSVRGEHANKARSFHENKTCAENLLCFTNPFGRSCEPMAAPDCENQRCDLFTVGDTTNAFGDYALDATANDGDYYGSMGPGEDFCWSSSIYANCYYRQITSDRLLNNYEMLALPLVPTDDVSTAAPVSAEPVTADPAEQYWGVTVFLYEDDDCSSKAVVGARTRAFSVDPAEYWNGFYEVQTVASSCAEAANCLINPIGPSCVQQDNTGFVWTEYYEVNSTEIEEYTYTATDIENYPVPLNTCIDSRHYSSTKGPCKMKIVRTLSEVVNWQ
jgi:hypothetical protein